MARTLIEYHEVNGFKLTRFDLDVWIRGRKGGYNYIRKNTDDVLVVGVEPTSIFKKLKQNYTIEAFRPPKVHLGYDYAQVKRVATTRWVVDSSTYITECLRKVCALLKVTTLRNEKLTCIPGDHPELYSSPLLCEAQHRLYQHLVGMAYRAVQIGSFDICYALTSLNRFLAAPSEGHLSRLVKIFGYFQSVTGRRKTIVVAPEDIEEISGKGANMKYWLEKYPGAL